MFYLLQIKLKRDATPCITLTLTRTLGTFDTPLVKSQKNNKEPVNLRNHLMHCPVRNRTKFLTSLASILLQEHTRG